MATDTLAPAVRVPQDPPQGLAQRGGGELAILPAELSIEELVARTKKVQDAMKAVMRDGEHYGVIPGTGTKPTLLKPGAEKLLNLFMLDPEYDAPPLYAGDHLTIVSRCTLYHIPTGARVGSGMGMCSTRESKYAYRQSKRACPVCGAEAIHKSKFPPRGRPNEAPGWYCFSKAGGCGAVFSADAAAITDQTTGRVDNPDKADQYNTVLKMANKRSLVAAVLNVTGASDIFTQDLEDDPPAPPGGPKPEDDEHLLTAVPDVGAVAPEDVAELVAKIKARWAQLNVSETLQRRQWAAHCGQVPFGEAAPTLDVSMLNILLGLLGAKR